MRLQEVCRDEKAGACTGMIYCEYQFDDMEQQSRPVIRQRRASGGFVASISPKALTIKAPKGIKSLQMWFRGTRPAYKDVFDSNWGKTSSSMLRLEFII